MRASLRKQILGQEIAGSKALNAFSFLSPHPIRHKR
jgi:hypothetical protein